VNTSTGTARKEWTYELRADTAMVSTPTRIASGVIDELGLRAVGRGSRRHEPTPEAADAYQRGLIVARRLESKADLDLAMTYFRKASAADSLYAEPYAMGAFVHQLASGLAGVPPTYAYPIADSLAWRAIQLDSNNAEAHAAFGFAEGVTAWRWEVGEREIIKALELDPNSPLAHLDYSILLATRGEQLRAIDEVNAAIRVDPQDAPKYLFRMLWYTQLGEPDSAIASFRQAQSKAPGFLFEGFFIGDAYRHRGMLDSAIALDSLASVGQGYPTPGLVMSLFARRQRDDAERAYHELEIAAQTGRFQLPEEVARAAEVLGDRDAALRWLGVAKSQHSDIMLLERYFPEMQSLRQDPRYRAMLREMRLPF